MASMDNVAVIQKETLLDIGAAIVETTKRAEDFPVRDMPRLIREEVFGAGYTKGYADGEANGGGADSWYYAGKLWQTFNEAVFPENYELTIHLAKPVISYQTFMKAANLKSVKIITDDKESPFDMGQAFRECPDLEIIDLSESSRSMSEISSWLFGSNNLKTIIGALDLSRVVVFTYSFFAGALADVEIVPGTIYKDIRFNSAYLTEASRQSIIDGLADLTASESQTLTLNGVASLLTNEQKTQITAKNWTLAY